MVGTARQIIKSDDCSKTIVKWSSDSLLFAPFLGSRLQHGLAPLTATCIERMLHLFGAFGMRSFSAEWSDTIASAFRVMAFARPYLRFGISEAVPPASRK